MSSSKNTFSSAVSPKVFVAVLLSALVLLGLLGWRTLSGQPPSAGTSIKVYPGMYDIRKMAQQRSTEGSNGSK